MKILYLGNSITLHMPAPEIGWHGQWGMAASAPEKDYAHRLNALLEQAGKRIDSRIENTADFEREPESFTEDTFRPHLDFAPDIVVLRIGENVPDEKAEAFGAAYEKLLRLLQSGGATVFAVGSFWKKDGVETAMREAAERTGARYVSLASVQGKEYQAQGLFEHEGVAAHPGDEGMDAIARIIFEAIREEGLLDGAGVRIVRPGEKLTHKELRYFARMAGRAYVNDPVHTYATKDPAAREKFVSHFMMERLHTSNGEDWFFIDEENRGVCVWRKARNEYGFFDFMLCADWVYLFAFLPRTIRTLAAYSPLDVKVFGEDTWIISPVFVAPEHQGQGIATQLIRKSMETLAPLGYTFGLEAQDERNVRFYERLGFKTIQEAYYKRGNIRHYYMVYQDET